MISPIDSLNRVKILSVILGMKCSAALAFHSYPELLSANLSSWTHTLSVPCSPWPGHSCPWLQHKASDSQTCNSRPELSSELSTHLSYYFWTFPLGWDKFPTPNTPKTSSSGSWLCLQVYMRPDRWMCAVESRKVLKYNTLKKLIHSTWPSWIFPPEMPTLHLFFSQEWCHPPTRQPNQKL